MTLQRTLALLLLAPALLPFAIWGEVVYPYLVPKVLLFYTCSLLALATFLVLVAHSKSFYASRLLRPVTWIPLGLLLVAYGASVIGTDFYRSFWSTFIRGDGLLMLSSMVGSFYLILLSADVGWREKFLRLVGWVGSAVALYGIGEWLIRGSERVGGLLGNAAFFAGYLGITIFITFLAARTYRRGTARVLRVGAVLQVIAVVLSGTRGTILALLVAGVGYLLLTALDPDASPRLRQKIAGLLVILGILGSGFVAFRGAFVDSSFAPLARLASISLEDATVANRIFVWEGMLTEAVKRPWTGVGAEHIAPLFNRFYDPTKISEQWFDRSHNAFIDYFAQYGLLGLVGYLALIGMLVGSAIGRWREGMHSEARILLALGAVYVVQNLFVFDTVSSLWLLVALIAVLRVTPADARTDTALSKMGRGGALGIACVLVIAIVPVAVRPAIAAHSAAQAYTYQVTDVARSIDYLEKGFAQDTYGNLEYGYEVYDMYVHIQREYLSGDSLEIAYRKAEEILTDNFYRFPYDARTALYLAHVLDSAPEGVAVDQELLLGAIERAIRLSPKRAQPWFILTNIAIEKANSYPPFSSGRIEAYAGAYDILSEYIQMVPEFPTPYFVRAELRIASGDDAGARADVTRGTDLYRQHPGDLEAARRAAGFYIREERLTEAKYFIQEVVRLEPGDTNARYDLAKVHFLLGEKEESLAIVEALRVDAPSILATDEAFLEAITAYEQSRH